MTDHRSNPMPTTTEAQRIEAAAQLLHERHHRAGRAPVCGTCRDTATAVALVLQPTGIHGQQRYVDTLTRVIDLLLQWQMIELLVGTRGADPAATVAAVRALVTT